jgi:thiamine biosynthesis protein ThiS
LRVHVNGERKELTNGLSLYNLIEQLELPTQRIAVELNRKVVRKSEWPTTSLNDGDRIEIVHFVGGGSAFASSRKSVYSQ